MTDKKGRIGDRIKALRTGRELSMEEVCGETQISESALVKIEKNQVNPPLGHIVSFARVFEVSVGEILGDAADSPFCIVRAGDREKVNRFNSTESMAHGYSYESLGSQKKNRQMEPFLVTLTPAEADYVEPSQHIGEEIIFVLSGAVEVKLADHTDILRVGDSIYYDSDIPHVVSCHGDNPATILAVIYAKDEMVIF